MNFLALLIKPRFISKQAPLHSETIGYISVACVCTSVAPWLKPLAFPIQISQMPFFSESGHRPPFDRFKRTVPFAIAAVIAMSLAAGACAWQFREARNMAQLEVDAQRLQRVLKDARVRSSEKAALAPNFAEVVPATVLIDPIVSQFQRSGAELGVGFVSVAVAERAPTPLTLGRVQLSVMLRGSYSNLKTVLAETFDRHPELILERLTMRRITAPADLEARVDLLLLTRPPFASASAR